MRSGPTFIILILTSAWSLGCAQRSDEAANQPVTTTMAGNMPSIAPIADAPKIAEDSLRAIEQKHSCQLPGDYRQFLLKYNGGMPSPDCVRFEEAGKKTASD